MTKKEMRLKEEVTRAVLSELTSLLTPENKNAVGKNLQEVAKIMAGYSDFNDRGVIGRYDGTFPLSTATKDNVYLEPKTGKYYRCETNYEGIQISAPNSNFVDLSVLANADRFGNLLTVRDTLYTGETISDTVLSIPNLSKYDLVLAVVSNVGRTASFTIPVYKGVKTYSTYEAGYMDRHYLEYNNDNKLHVKTEYSGDGFRLGLFKVIGILKINNN